MAVKRSAPRDSNPKTSEDLYPTEENSVCRNKNRLRFGQWRSSPALYLALFACLRLGIDQWFVTNCSQDLCDVLCSSSELVQTGCDLAD